jgi:hypothetical protein
MGWKMVDYTWVQILEGVPKSYHNVTFFYLSYLVFVYHVKTCLWIIMMESKIVMGLKYSPSKFFDNFWLIIFYGDQNIKLKRLK